MCSLWNCQYENIKLFWLHISLQAYMDKKLYMYCTKDFAVYSLIEQGMINKMSYHIGPAQLSQEELSCHKMWVSNSHNRLAGKNFRIFILCNTCISHCCKNFLLGNNYFYFLPFQTVITAFTQLLSTLLPDIKTIKL